MDVETKIRNYMSANGISQIDLCKKTRIAPAKLNLSLNKKRRLTFMEYQTICWALGVGVDEFMEPINPEEAAS